MADPGSALFSDLQPEDQDQDEDQDLDQDPGQLSAVCLKDTCRLR